MYVKFGWQLVAIFGGLVVFKGKAVVPGHVEDDASSNHSHTYDLAKKAYLSNDWKVCVDLMEAAIRQHRVSREKLTSCRLKCHQSLGQEKLDRFLVSDDVENMHFFETMIKVTLCLMKTCGLGVKDSQADVNVSVEEEFRTLTPYEYLHVCYYQIGDLRKASEAAFTHHVHNPEDKMSQDNVDWYRQKLEDAGIDQEGDEGIFRDREAYVHTSLFKSGVEAYVKEQWSKVTSAMEEAVRTVIETEERCRIECEKPFDMGWYPDFVMAVSNHYVFCLKCKQNCKVRLAFNYYDDIPSLDVPSSLQSMYFYLMYAYYKNGDLQAVPGCIESFLLFAPGDETMLTNKNYFLDQNLDQGLFVPRPEALKYFNRHQYETKLLEFIETNFVFDQGKPIEGVDGSKRSNLPRTVEEDPPMLPEPPPVLDQRSAEL